MASAENSSGNPLPTPQDHDFLTRLRTAPASETHRLLLEYTCTLTAEFLTLDDHETIGPQDSFLAFGFDSLMAVDFKILLEERLDCALRSTALFDCPTPEALADYLIEALQLAGAGQARQALDTLSGQGRSTEHTPDAATLDTLSAEELRALVSRQSARLRSLEDALHEPIAIVGMACRFPGGANDADSFWALQRDGVDAIVEIPKSRWDIDAYYHPEHGKPGKMYVRHGGFVDHVDTFDARFFGISPREATELDPNQRILLETAHEAIERAGISPDDLKGTPVGVFVGSRGAEYLIGQSDITPEDIQTYYATGNALSTLAGRVSYALGFTGPSFALDTACSSSLVALHCAVQSLRRGECNAAIVGGINTLLDPLGTISVCKASMLSEDGRCKTFDAAANGYVRSEGCGVLLLKRLSRAEADGDSILALVRGTAINQDGASGGLTVPSGPRQEEVIRQALANGGVKPDEVSYVEAHGTGTSLGDPIEVGALDGVFGPGRPADKPLISSSVKTNIGHLETAAGMAGLIKVLVAMRNECIPRHLHLSEPNPHIPWDETVIEVPLENTPWPGGDTPRFAGVSSFGFSGTNAHVVLQDAPTVRPRSGATRPVTVLPLAAASEKALDEMVSNYSAHLADLDSTAPDASLADVCATAATGRGRFPFRRAFVADSLDELRQQLGEVAAGKPAGLSGHAPSHPPKVGFLFTGQGSQHAEMGKQLYAAEPAFHDALDRCAALLGDHMPVPLLSLLWGEHTDLLGRTDNTQPALFAIEYSIAMLLDSWGVRPAWVAGHSVGEYAAATIAGVLSLEDACALIAARGRLMVEHTQPGSMLAVNASAEVVRSLIGSDTDAPVIAAVNGEESVVLSGSHEAVDRASAAIAAKNVRCTPLDVSHAFHSALMEPMLEPFEALAQSIAFARPTVGFVSNLDPGPADANLTRADYWVRHVRDPVRFLDGMRALDQEGCDILVEIGPAPVLSGMAKRFLRRKDLAWIPTLRPGQDEPRALQTALGELSVLGVAVDWHGVHRGFAHRRTPLPTYPFQRERFWLPPRKESGARTLDASVHPLLGVPVEAATLEPGHLLHQSWLSEDSPGWLADHRAFDEALVPAAAFLEWVLAAGASLLGTTDLQLTDVTIPAALPLDASPRLVQLHLAPRTGEGHDTGGHDFRLLSRGEGEAAWTEHASGCLADAPARTAEAHDLAAIEARCTEDLDVADFYAGYDAIGLGYGPGFSVIQSLHRGDGECLARLQRPDEVPTLPGGVLHPVLLDGCFQTTRALSLQQGVDGLYLPTALERLTVTRAEEDAVFCRTTMRPLPDASGADDSGAPRRLVMDLELLDEQGRPVAHAEGLQLVRADRAALLAGNDPFRALAHTVRWDAVEREPAPAVAPGSWWVLEDATDSGHTLSAALQARGAHTCAVSSREIPSDDDNAWDRLVETLPDDCRGIVHAFALAPADETHPSGVTAGSSRPADPADPARRRTLCGSALGLVKALAKRTDTAQDPPRLALVTRGAVPAGADGDVTDVEAGSLWGLGITLELEHPEWRPGRFDLDPHASPEDAASALADELLAGDPETQVAWRNGVRHVARLSKRPARVPRLHPPEAPAWALRVREYGVLDNLELMPRPRPEPGPGEIEIEVAAAALNFKDVLFALGMLAEHTGIRRAPEQPLGLECAGLVTRVGTGVTAFAPGDEVVSAVLGSMASHVIAPVHGVIRKPAALTVAEAASLQTIFLTALYALERRAAIRPGDTVLVHAAAGGVGQAAVQIAQRAGAEVFATASPGKWPILKAQGVTHVMNSRTTDFAVEVLAATDGRGVDVVLNSLNGEAIPASLRALAQGGRFIDIGKIGVWSDDQVAAERPDAAYATFDMAEVLDADRPLHTSLLDDLARGFDDGSLHAPPVKTWPLGQAVSAFSFLARAQNVGKVVLTLPTPKESRVRADASYLVTGGLGALGRSVARRLVELGARHLVLCGRSAPSTAARATIAELETLGAEVRTAAVDVADRASVHELLDGITPRLAGIVHAAGVLDDGMLRNQEWSRFERVFAPKIDGAWILHEWSATRTLDWFVCFSSMASMLGNPGQGNYAAANAMLDALAHHRRMLGLPACSVNWGPWAGGGMAADIAERAEARLFEMGVAPIPQEHGAQVFERILGVPDLPQVGVLPVTWSRFLSRHRQATPPFYSLLVGAGRTEAPTADGDIHDQLAGASLEQTTALLTRFVSAQLASVMGFASGDDVDIHQEFADMGIDSLLAVDLRNRLEASLAITLPATLVFDHPNLASLIDALALQLTTDGDDPAEAVDDEAALLAEIEQLSDEEAERLLATQSENDDES